MIDQLNKISDKSETQENYDRAVLILYIIVSNYLYYYSLTENERRSKKISEYTGTKAIKRQLKAIMEDKSKYEHFEENQNENGIDENENDEIVEATKGQINNDLKKLLQLDLIMKHIDANSYTVHDDIINASNDINELHCWTLNHYISYKEKGTIKNFLYFEKVEGAQKTYESLNTLLFNIQRYYGNKQNIELFMKRTFSLYSHDVSAENSTIYMDNLEFKYEYDHHLRMIRQIAEMLKSQVNILIPKPKRTSNIHIKGLVTTYFFLQKLFSMHNVKIKIMPLGTETLPITTFGIISENYPVYVERLYIKTKESSTNHQYTVKGIYRFYFDPKMFDIAKSIFDSEFNDSKCLSFDTFQKFVNELELSSNNLEKINNLVNAYNLCRNNFNKEEYIGNLKQNEDDELIIDFLESLELSGYIKKDDNSFTKKISPI